mmetsp:Transcript_40371/g.125624  ORF Transcript_40371/g.125624 Transcript_40371/m.125624 type:complete len:177 (+) Transcript_40371:66-596(+)
MSLETDAAAGIELAGSASPRASTEEAAAEACAAPAEPTAREETAGGAAASTAASAAAETRPSPRVLPLSVPEDASVGSRACPHRAQLAGGAGRKVVGAIAGLGYRVVDNMSFVGEVLVDWLDLDKPRYYHEVQQMRRRRQNEEKRRRRQEAAAIASIEEAASGDSPASRPSAQAEA